MYANTGLPLPEKLVFHQMVECELRCPPHSPTHTHE